MKFLQYITNNEEKSRHEEIFDVIFFILNTLALIGGTIVLIVMHEPQWIAFLVIEYNWALDTLRHNRP